MQDTPTPGAAGEAAVVWSAERVRALEAWMDALTLAVASLREHFMTPEGDKLWNARETYRLFARACQAPAAPPAQSVGPKHTLLTCERATIFAFIEAELHRAQAKHGLLPWSHHEFYAILKEEVDELWDAVKTDGPEHLVQSEALQVAAVAVRYLTTSTPQLQPQ